MTNDPAALFREMLGQWEKMANGLGGDALKSEEFARSLHGAGNATMAMQSALGQAMDRALAATNLPSRTDLTELSARVGRIEDAIARIETLLSTGDAASAAMPSRTRKPPTDPAQS